MMVRAEVQVLETDVKRSCREFQSSTVTDLTD